MGHQSDICTAVYLSLSPVYITHRDILSLSILISFTLHILLRHRENNTKFGDILHILNIFMHLAKSWHIYTK